MVALQVAVAMLATLAPNTAASGDVVLLDFTAAWCGPCQQVKPTVDQLAAEGYPVRVVDIDQHAELARRFQVSSIPCFIVVKDGQPVARQEGPISRQAMIGMLRQAGYGSAPAIEPVVRAQSPSGFTSTQSSNPVFDAQGIPTHPEAKKWQRYGNAPAWRGGNDPSTRFVQVNPYGPTVQPDAAQTELMHASAEQPAQAQLASYEQPAAGGFDTVPAGRTDDFASLPAKQCDPPASTGDDLLAGSNEVRDDFRTAADSRFDGSPEDIRDPLVRRLLEASVRLKIQDPDGHSYGSGTIIDARAGEALVLTCGHVFRDSAGKGEILVHFHGKYEETPVRGTLISFDLQNDVGLVSIPVDDTVVPAKVAPRDYAARRSDRVLSIGCDNGHPATARWSQIIAVNSIVGRPTYQVAGQPEVGRSGGGLFTSDGQLIGICNFADPTDRAGLYAALETAQEELDEAGLSFVYSDRHAVPESIAAAERNASPANPPAMDDRMPEAPLAAASELRTRGGSVAVTPAAQGGQRKELICIVRGDGGGQQETIIIRDPSPALLSRLADEHKSQSGAFFTSGRVEQASRELVPIQR